MPVILDPVLSDPYVTLDDKDGVAVLLHETPNRGLSGATGLIGVGAPRESRRVRPQAHGGVDESRYEDGRLIVLEGETYSHAGHQDASSEFNAILRPMIQTWDYGPALLKWDGFGGTVPLQRLVKLASEVEPPIEDGAWLRYQAQFFAEDPRAYSQTLTTTTGSVIQAGSGAVFPATFNVLLAPVLSGEATVTNAGIRPTPLVLRVYGYCVNATIILVGAGVQIALTGTIAPGDYLELDTQARTARLNGVSPAQEYVDAANTTWFDLPEGLSTIRLIAGSNDLVARVDVLHRDAY